MHTSQKRTTPNLKEGEIHTQWIRFIRELNCRHDPSTVSVKEFQGAVREATGCIACVGFFFFPSGLFWLFFLCLYSCGYYLSCWWEFRNRNRVIDRLAQEYRGVLRYQ
eukprot:TRINITY_DN9128_c0_g2_i2.p1 TRINITY_DN9128_c0_g2~~TRINITY_DN9128_c0_g2_i2.p1  ORF type:complete len:108 (+),score=10.24 TRINITY_DN9128_c0_g2_i2:712-1035(+)